MKKQFFTVLVIVGTTVLFSGCAKFPEAEVGLAKIAIENARSAGAEVYVADQFNALQDSLNAVIQTLEIQKSKWLPNYKNEIGQLATVGSMASDVIVKTEERKTEIRSEIQTSLAQIQALLTENNDLITNAPKGKEGSAALNQIKEELLVVETAVTEAGAMMENDDLMAALVKAKSAQEKASSINTELKDAMAKYNRKKI